MSQDIAIERVCDHYIVEDVAFINSDYRTIDLIRDLAATQSLILKKNGFVITSNNTAFPWALALSTNYIGNKAIRFVEVQKSNDDFYELSYTTSLAECPKCLGSGFEFDYSLDVLGHVVTVENEDKLLQDMVKGTITISGSNPYYKWYGTVVDALVGTKITNFTTIRVTVATDVQSLVDNLKDMQTQQAAVATQQVTLNEMINALLSITVTQPDPANEPTLIEIAIVFSNMAGNIRMLTRTLDLSKINGSPLNYLKIG